MTGLHPMSAFGVGSSLAAALIRGASRLAAEAKAPEWLSPAQTRT